MKRRDLVRHLERQGCELVREGSAHSVFANRKFKKVTTVPRHREINDFLARRICNDLEIPEP
jgi:mRNA interferase HicA